ncbi:hypothetical protein R3P38DRAFT_3317686 [Favolaschia claudopus]|uniref:Uncharacterized protein n=1 Tax=Favolaschia claudopus TaxID=2862362 RepID=A0AAW0B8P8_9AGAR
MSLSKEQCAAYAAKKLLDDAGLTTPLPTNDHGDADADLSDVTHVVSQALLTSPSPPHKDFQYIPPHSRPFTAEELRRGRDCINRQTYVHAVVEHRAGATTGTVTDVAVAHIFSVDPANFTHPKESFQYSLGDTRWGESNVFCRCLLLGQNGNPVYCGHKRTGCKGLKYCSARSLAILPALKLDSLGEAKKEIFLKTLAFYCTLMEKGCAFDVCADGEDITTGGLTGDEPESDSESDGESETEMTGTTVVKDCRRKKPTGSVCKGKLELRCDEYGRSLIQCRFRTRTDKAHLILRTLDEFDIPYLRALLENDSGTIHELEELARQFGYGPRAPCSFTASPSAQKEFCPYWHRSEGGNLARGTLRRPKNDCDARFDIYTPYDLDDCPKIVVICRNPHSHVNPHPVKTPPPLLEIFRGLLLELDWRLADMTPRKLMVDSGFMSNFRRALGWKRPFDPTLAALHPSLGNLDHVRRYIDELRHVLFPEGTGFDGAQLLAAQHRELPEDEQYVRCAETHTIEDGKTFNLVICMLKSMSRFLMRAKTLSLDTAFRRLAGKWQEFEMETWELMHMKSVVGTRAFTTSQSAEAHLILFTRIFEIAAADTGIPCRFRHIHGEGFELWITDAHKGQALGAGMFCKRLSATLGDVYCPMEPSKLLRLLDPYEHLRRFLRFCTVHLKRNINELKPYTTQKVRNAMLSLSSSQPHPDLEGAFTVIESGGRKAKAWLKDKRIGSKFALAAIYQPASLIPLELWKSAPSTTNGNEQAHRNINRDGVNLTILGGIMRGMQYDARAMEALQLHSAQGIYSNAVPPPTKGRKNQQMDRYTPLNTMRLQILHVSFHLIQCFEVFTRYFSPPLAPSSIHSADEPLAFWYSEHLQYEKQQSAMQLEPFVGHAEHFPYNSVMFDNCGEPGDGYGYSFDPQSFEMPVDDSVSYLHFSQAEYRLPPYPTVPFKHHNE